jgi:hypothetical protein
VATPSREGLAAVRADGCPARRAAARASWIADKGLTVFSLWSPDLPGLEVGLFVEEPFAFDEACTRAVRVDLDATWATVASLQDLVEMKRAAGRPLDLADVEALEPTAGTGGRA